jgi:hypothetical protein
MIKENSFDIMYPGPPEYLLTMTSRLLRTAFTVIVPVTVTGVTMTPVQSLRMI